MKAKIFPFLILIFIMLLLLAPTARCEYEAVLNKDTYLYQEPGNPLAVALWVPYLDERVIRGILVDGNAGNGNNLPGVAQEHMQAFAREHGFGVMASSGVSGGRTYDEFGQFFLDALDIWADMGIHPELSHAPFITHGSSSAGANAYGLAMLVPDRTICFTPNVQAGFNPMNPPAAGFKVPGLITIGEVDPLVGWNIEQAHELMPAARAAGARWAWMLIQGMGHEHRRVYRMFYQFWETCIRLRLPGDANPRLGPVELIDLPEESGWLADNQSWESGITQIYPYAEFDGDLTQTSWLPDKANAIAYRSYSSWNQPMYFNIDGLEDYDEEDGKVIAWFDPGDEVTLVCDPGDFLDWTKMEFFSGAEKAGEITEGEPRLPVVLAEDPLVQVFSVLAHDGEGNTRTAVMQSVLVLQRDHWIKGRGIGWYYGKHDPWFYHNEWGWIYVHSGYMPAGRMITFYWWNRRLWYYVTGVYYPWMYNFAAGAWEYYQPEG